MSRLKTVPKKLTYTTPESRGLNKNIRTRSLRVIDFIHNDNLLPDNNNGSRWVAYATGLSPSDFITPQIFNKSFKGLFEEGQSHPHT